MRVASSGSLPREDRLTQEPFFSRGSTEVVDAVDAQQAADARFKAVARGRDAVGIDAWLPFCPVDHGPDHGLLAWAEHKPVAVARDLAASEPFHQPPSKRSLGIGTTVRMTEASTALRIISSPAYPPWSPECGCLVRHLRPNESREDNRKDAGAERDTGGDEEHSVKR